MKDDKGEPMGYVIGGTDITKQKETENKLKESENRFKEVADSAPVMIWMQNADRIITYTNNLWNEFTGVDVNGKDEESCFELIHPDDLNSAKEKFDAAYKNRDKVIVTYRIRSYDGSYRWVQDVSVPRYLNDGSFLGYIGSVVDIQGQKEIEEQLYYQANILKNVTDIIVTTDLSMKVVTLNKVAELYYGISQPEAIGKPITNLVGIFFNNVVVDRVRHDLFEKGIWEEEVSFTNKIGEEKHIHYVVTFINDSKGNQEGILTVGRDVTERKRAEKNLQESELFYRTLIDDSHNTTMLLDEGGTIKFISKAVENVLGFSADELIGKYAFEYINPADISWAL
jgi:PAS domain S-box-containing protein